jgi:hypothetical protein
MATLIWHLNIIDTSVGAFVGSSFNGLQRTINPMRLTGFVP